MSVLTDAAERLRALFRRGREERELGEELEFHLEMEARRHVEAGLTPVEARRRARLEFGGADRIAEQVRDARGVRPLEEVIRDVRHAVRSLVRRPGFTIVAVATLAVGIGASTAMFTLVNSVLLRPLSYADADRLVAVWERPPQEDANNFTSLANLNAWRDQSATLEQFAAWADRPLNLVDGNGPLEAQVRWSTQSYFTVLGARALLGRTILPADDAGPYAVLSHDLWQARYGGDESVIGRTITGDGEAMTVIGVMGPDFRSVHGEPDLWVSMPDLPPDSRGRFLSTVARLRPGATIEEARTEMDAIAARLAAEYPEYNRDWGVNVIPLQEEVTGEARPALLILLGAVSLLLVIACANVASLFLGRAAARTREMAVRRSLGASRRRLVMHTMTEAVVVAVIAGALGLLLAHWAMSAVVGVLPQSLALPRLDEVGLDARVFVFAVAVTLLTGMVFGAAPALAGSAVRPGAALRDSARGSTAGRSRLRSALVVAEVALAVVLLAGAGLLVRTVYNLTEVDPGLRAEGVLTLRTTMTTERYREPEARIAFMDEVLTGLSSRPGAVAAGAIGWLPLAGAKSASSFFRDDLPRPRPGTEPGADVRVIAGDYFAAMGVPLLRGRTFDRTDSRDAPVRYIVNQALVDRYYAGEDPIGRTLTLPWNGEESGEIVGVVGSIRETSLDEEPSPALYRPYAQDPWGSMTAVVRTTGDPMAFADAAAAAIHEVDPAMPVGRVRALQGVVDDTLVRQRLSMMLLVGFAAVSLLLVIIGLYGVIAYSVAQRTREIGVRMALGAPAAAVRRMIVRQGLVLAALGLLIGTAAAALLGRLMTGMLYGVAPADPATLLTAAGLLTATAFAASYVPAVRATRIDPAAVLGSEG